MDFHFAFLDLMLLLEEPSIEDTIWLFNIAMENPL